MKLSGHSYQDLWRSILNILKFLIVADDSTSQTTVKPTHAAVTEFSGKLIDRFVPANCDFSISLTFVLSLFHNTSSGQPHCMPKLAVYSDKCCEK